MDVIEKHKPGPNGYLLDDVTSRQMSRNDHGVYADVQRRQLAKLAVPTLLHASNPHERLFIANFDGTGNDADADPTHRTNISLLFKALDDAGRMDRRIASRYLKGPGTQENAFEKLADGVLGYTHQKNIRNMYSRLTDQASEWLREDPQAEIRVLATGFSRGGVQAAGFVRMIDEHGIRDHDAVYVPPHRTLTGVILADPVATGIPYFFDRHLPSNVAFGIQIVARDERRDQFPSNMIIRQGLSPDARLLGVTVPGAHSDIGGSYHQDGLAILNFNIVSDVVNSAIEGSPVRKMAPPIEAGSYGIHDSVAHNVVYSDYYFEKHGERDTRGAQILPPHCRAVEKCAPPEPFDSRLEALVGPRHPVEVMDTPAPTPARSQNVAPVVSMAPSVVPTKPSTAIGGGHAVRLPSELQERDNSIDFRAFDVDRHKEVGNIPVPPDFFHRPDTTPESSLITVHREPNPHPSRAAELRRDVELANAQTAQELALPHTHAQDPTLAHAQGKVASVDQERAESQDRTEPRNPIDQQAPSQRPSQPEGMPRRSATAEHESAINHQVTPSEARNAPVPSPHTPDPRHPDHPDHKMHTTVGFLLAEEHVRAGVDLTPEQLERLTSHVLVEAKRAGLKEVTHVELGQDPKTGQVTPNVIIHQAHLGDVDDPRTLFTHADATRGLATPVETSNQELQAVNQSVDQQQDMQARQQEHSASRSMSM